MAAAVPPVIQSASQTMVVSVGDRTVLPCVTSGNPTPTITWYYDRRRINPRDPKYTLMDDGSLVINNVQVSVSCFSFRCVPLFFSPFFLFLFPFFLFLAKFIVAAQSSVVGSVVTVIMIGNL